MTEQETSAQRPLTLGDVIRDLGWFSWLFAIVVAGPSILSILQQVFVERRLLLALQWIVEGYNDIAAVLGAIVEPLVQPAVSWANAQFDWSLTLHPHWQALFALLVTYVAALARPVLRAGFSAVVLGVALVCSALLGALFAGFAPLDGSWWTQGLAASAPFAPPLLVGTMLAGSRARAAALVQSTALLAFLFALGAGLSFFTSGAGVIALGVSVLLAGVSFLTTGLRERSRYDARVGLTMLGGFLAAGIVGVADAAMSVLS